MRACPRLEPPTVGGSSSAAGGGGPPIPNCPSPSGPGCCTTSAPPAPRCAPRSGPTTTRRWPRRGRGSGRPSTVSANAAPRGGSRIPTRAAHAGPRPWTSSIPRRVSADSPGTTRSRGRAGCDGIGERDGGGGRSRRACGRRRGAARSAAGRQPRGSRLPAPSTVHRPLMQVRVHGDRGIGAHEQVLAARYPADDALPGQVGGGEPRVPHVARGDRGTGRDRVQPGRQASNAVAYGHPTRLRRHPTATAHAAHSRPPFPRCGTAA